MKNVEYICGVCNVLCQTPALLDRHNTSASHIKVLKKYNVFPTPGLKEFSLEYFLQLVAEIRPGKHHLYKEDKRYWCKICGTASNDLINLHQHNAQESAFGARASTGARYMKLRSSRRETLLDLWDLKMARTRKQWHGQKW